MRKEDYWGQGIGTEAWFLLTDYAFSVLKLKTIYTKIFKDNLPSLKIAEKCGFREKSISSEDVAKNGCFFDRYLLQLTKYKWDQVKVKKTYEECIDYGCSRIAGLNEDDPFRKKPCSHVGAYQGNPEFEVKGVCDINKEAAENFANKFGIPGKYNDIKKALSAIKPELVSIAVPYEFNSEIVHTVAQHINRPKMIFCEKPIASSLHSAEKMVRVCKENQVLFYINNRRLTGIYDKLEKIFHNDLGGDAITVNAWCSSGLHAVGIHMIDLLRKIFGDIEWVKATPEKEKVASLPYSDNYTINDPRVNAQIGFKNGVVGNFTNTALTSFTYFEMEILCRKEKNKGV